MRSVATGAPRNGSLDPPKDVPLCETVPTDHPCARFRASLAFAFVLMLVSKLVVVASVSVLILARVFATGA